MIKIFISYFKPYKKLFYLDLFVVSIATICDLIYPIMTRILVKELCKGRTTIVVAHRLSTIKNADEIVVLTDKGIEEIGSHDELINIGGIYSELNKYAMVN